MVMKAPFQRKLWSTCAFRVTWSSQPQGPQGLHGRVSHDPNVTHMEIQGKFQLFK